MILHIGNKELEVYEDDSSVLYLSLMKSPELTLKFHLPYWVDIPVNAWVEFWAKRYYVTDEPSIKKISTRDIEYTLTMSTEEAKLTLYKMRNIVDRRLKFSMCARPEEFLKEIVENLNLRFGKGVWKVGEYIDSNEKTIEFNHTDIASALQSVADTFETEWEIVGTTIHLRKVEYFKESPITLSYGKGNGFVSGLGRSVVSGEKPIKRLYAQGGDQNIDRSKNNGVAELLLPKSQSLEYDGRTYTSDGDGYYIERTDKVSNAEKEDSLDCAEIYPKRIGEVTAVEVVDEEKNFYDFIDNTIPVNLDFNDYIIEGEKPFIRFQSGMLAGEKDFNFQYVHKERRFKLEPQMIDGVPMPCKSFVPKIGDKYIVFGIFLPKEYVCDNDTKTGASWDMFRDCAKHLRENEDQKFTFSGILQGLWAKKNWNAIGGKLMVGGYVNFFDEQFASDGVLIRIVGIKYNLNNPHAPTLELSNEKSSASILSAIRDIKNTEVAIESAKSEMKRYANRKWRDARETMEALQDAMLNFDEGINPVTVNTMTVLVGDESLQFRFVEDFVDYIPTSLDIDYNKDEKRLYIGHSYLQHMTLGINYISSFYENSEYKQWEIDAFRSDVLLDGSARYYIYAKVEREGHDGEKPKGWFELSETAKGLEDSNEYYYLLVGILNREVDGDRSYVELYGYTEIQPSRITTDKLISADGKTYFDLTNGTIGGNILFLSDNNEYKTLIEGGKIKTEFLDVKDVTAKRVVVGDENGKHVLIEPNEVTQEGNIKIFDESNNEAIVMEGTTYAGILQLFSDYKAGSLTFLRRNKEEYGAGGGNSMNMGRHITASDVTHLIYHDVRKIILTNPLYSEAMTEVSLSGSLLLSAFSDKWDETSESQKKINRKAVASLAVAVDTYLDEELTTLVDSSVLFYHSLTADSNTTKTKKEGSWISHEADTQTTGVINFVDTKVRASAGYHTLSLYVDFNVGIGCNCVVEWGNIRSDEGQTAFKAKYSNDFYVSRFFANGLCLGSGKDNYLAAFRDGNKMHLKMETGNIGLDISESGIKTRFRSKVWMPMPMLLYKAKYLYNNRAYTNDGRVISFDGSVIPVERISEGAVKITYPTYWREHLENLGDKTLIVHVNGCSTNRDARVHVVDETGIAICMSDDETLNDASFSIEIYYLA